MSNNKTMKQYRIKQIGEDKFIAQVRYFIFNKWRSIDRKKDGIEYLYEWSIPEGIKWCICDTLQEANMVIIDHKNKSKYPKYPKYHKPFFE
jgi:hypothetical protein